MLPQTPEVSARVDSPAPLAQVVHLDPDKTISLLQSRIDELEKQNRHLRRNVRLRREDRKRLKHQYECRGVFIRVIAELYFGQDDNSRWFAGLDGKPVDGKTALEHWWKNGGSDEFRSRFPTPESVMQYFRQHHDEIKP